MDGKPCHLPVNEMAKTSTVSYLKWISCADLATVYQISEDHPSLIS